MANNPPPVEDRRLELSDLPDDVLMEILSRVPVKKQFVVERVSRTWKRCVGLVSRSVLNQVQVIVFDKDDDKASCENIDPTCSHLRLARNNRQTLFVDVSKFFNQSYLRNRITCVNIDGLNSLVARCPGVKCLELSQVKAFSSNFSQENFVKLINVFPELECLCLRRILGLMPIDGVEWHRFAGQLSSKLIHLMIQCPDSRFQLYPDYYYLDLNSLLTGAGLRQVHLGFSYSFGGLLNQLRDRPEIDLSLDFEWIESGCDFNGFDHLTFIFKQLTSEYKYFFKAIEDPTPAKSTKTLKVGLFSSENPFVRKSLIVFNTLECLEMHNVVLDENLLKCRFERLETLQLVNTSATDDAVFAKLFCSIQQLKELVIKVDKWQPIHRYLLDQSLAILKRLETLHFIITCLGDDADFGWFYLIKHLKKLTIQINYWQPTYKHLLYQSLIIFKHSEKFELKLAIENEERIRMRELFDALVQMSSLKFIKIICNFNQFITIPEVFKKELIVHITVWSSVKICFELRFNKQQFDEENAMDEVMDWYYLACQFEQIDKTYTEEENVHKIQISTKDYN